MSTHGPEVRKMDTGARKMDTGARKMDTGIGTKQGGEGGRGCWVLEGSLAGRSCLNILCD